MADPSIVAAQVHESTIKARAVVDAHGKAKRKERLAQSFPDVPQPTQDALRFGAYQAELTAATLEIVEDQAKTLKAQAKTLKDQAEQIADLDTRLDALETPA